MYPEVSIVIPCYNDEKYVSYAVESALAQTYSSVDVIVVNDGSTDGSADVITPYRDEITYTETGNHGAGHARNVGLKQATGTYVKFLDADDELYETAVEAQVRQMEELSAGSSRQIVFGDAKFVDESGETVRESDYRRSKKNENDVEYILKVNPQTSLPIHRRSWLLEVDGFDESLPRAQEYDLHVRLSLKGVSFRYEKELVSRVKVHDGEDRITNKDHFQENPEALLSRIRKRRKMIEESGLLNERIRQYLAHDAWRGGRMALRKGLDDIASTYFGVARSLHHDPLRGWAPAYQWCTHLFGPRIAERIGTCMRTVKATLK